MTRKSQVGEKNNNYKHGMSRINDPTYKVWIQMRRRCRERPGYVDRGITVCERWSYFDNFLSDMGPRPDGLQLDRVDNNGGYSPENCRWATPKDNCNNRRNTPVITYNGVTNTASGWAVELGIQRQTIAWRLRQGWAVERILSTTG